MIPALTEVQRRSGASRKAAHTRKVMALALPHRLSRQQARVFNFIAGVIAETGQSPSAREIVDAFGLTSVGHINGIISVLVEQGYLLRRVIPTYTELTLVNPASVSLPIPGRPSSALTTDNATPNPIHGPPQTCGPGGTRTPPPGPSFAAEGRPTGEILSS